MRLIQLSAVDATVPIPRVLLRTHPYNLRTGITEDVACLALRLAGCSVRVLEEDGTAEWLGPINGFPIPEPEPVNEVYQQWLSSLFNRSNESTTEKGST